MDSQKSLKDLLAGLIFLAFGLAFGYASMTYEVGSALRMGPGYFPLVLAITLVALGAAILVKSFTAGNQTELGPVPWFGLALLVGALLFFGATVRGLGLAPALLVTIFLSAFASRKNGIVSAAILSVSLTAFCLAIFVFALGLPLPILGPWARF